MFLYLLYERGRLTFYSTGEDTFDNIFLADHVENNNRDDSEHQHCHHSAPVQLPMALLQILDGDRKGFILVNI